MNAPVSPAPRSAGLDRLVGFGARHLIIINI
jgi:hypothetical protein